MRLLICETCRKPAMLRDGTEYTIGRAPSHWPFRLWCARCKKVTWLKAQDFNRMPNAEEKDPRIYRHAKRTKIEEWRASQARKTAESAGSPTPESKETLGPDKPTSSEEKDTSE